MRRQSYTAAMEKFDQALVLANEDSTITKIRENKSAVRTALYKQKQNEDALKVNKEGEEALTKGEYETAVKKFKEAYQLSNEMSTIDLTKRNLTKATRAHNAKQKNEEGNSLLREKNYQEAIKKFDEALELAEGSLILSNIKNNKLEAWKQYGKVLYEEGWLLESNENEDRSVEARNSFNKAKDMFQKAGVEDSLALVKLKIAGNELFNEGANLEREASNLYEKANETQMVDDYSTAQKKYEDVLKKYEEAKNKLDEGSSVDQKFVSSVDYMNDQIGIVRRKIEKIEEKKLSGHVRNVSFDSKKKDRVENVVNNVGKVNYIAD